MKPFTSISEPVHYIAAYRTRCTEAEMMGTLLIAAAALLVAIVFCALIGAPARRTERPD
jgi:hypothetical protein